MPVGFKWGQIVSLHSGWIARCMDDHVSSFSLCVFVLLSLRVVHLTVQDGISTTIVCRVLLFVVWPLRE